MYKASYRGITRYSVFYVLFSKLVVFYNGCTGVAKGLSEFYKTLIKDFLCFEQDLIDSYLLFVKDFTVVQVPNQEVCGFVGDGCVFGSMLSSS